MSKAVWRAVMLFFCYEARSILTALPRRHLTPLVLREQIHRGILVLTRCQLWEFSEKPMSVLEKPIFVDFVEVIPIFVGINLIINCKCLRKKIKNHFSIFYLYLSQLSPCFTESHFRLKVCSIRATASETETISSYHLLYWHSLHNLSFHRTQLLPRHLLPINYFPTSLDSS